MIALRAVAAPAPVVIPCALKLMRNEQTFVVGAGFQGKVLLAADTAMGHAFVVFRAGGARNRRKWAAGLAAHDKLQVAVAYLCHGFASFFFSPP